ncbi:MAG: carbon monoxide dehydrogenase [SAR116 cluster bacterium MED-G04]|jgi:carbon-monoxide dehydrogenase small subunit|nr:MAG: carbon monoxide dehydrogenase [SAR116 cluster bacterium MED-G04]CAI8448705.1 MAG: Carbon monoxide dehydrogenase small chain [SAR116 cluster bacterium MED-G04]HCD49221.1 carbon monoxide dehydrogenase [Alphaproteobacteria bacterium]|tara:strand:+ start:917 stop:1384 length:468 start_codon:yes stop_codon:yes gene_type:complete
MISITMTINGQSVRADIPDNTLLVDFIREHQGLTGTHVGCDTSQCGACVIHIDGRSVKSCTMLAAQANGRALTTIEGIGDAQNLHPMQQAFHDNHGLQCGFCTPGMIMSAIDFVDNSDNPDEAAIRDALEGNICRCTGYHNIVKAVQAAVPKMDQ